MMLPVLWPCAPGPKVLRLVMGVPEDGTFASCASAVEQARWGAQPEEDEVVVCEYCGCQSLRAVEELTREHDAALGEIRLARTALARDDGPAAAEAAARLLELLGPHTAVEEEALFPAMAADHPDHVAVLRREHQQVHAVLADVALGRGWSGPETERLRQALDVLSEHILKEQDGLFPAALICLSGADWDAVEQVRARVGTRLSSAPAGT